jgi:Flp pilus assembly protein TadG
MNRIRPALRALGRDQRGFVLNFFVRLILVFAILAVAINEVGQVLIATVDAHNAAGSAARAAADSYHRTSDLGLAQQAAVTAAGAEDPEAKVINVSISPADGSATVMVKTTATTLVMSRVSWLKPWDIRRASETETPSTSP